MPHGFADFGGVQADRISEPQARRFGRKPFGRFKDKRGTILKMDRCVRKVWGSAGSRAALNDEGVPTRSGKGHNSDQAWLRMIELGTEPNY